MAGREAQKGLRVLKLKTVSEIVLCYVAAAIVVFAVLTPVQALLLPEVTPQGSLCYLPHGVRVIAIWFYREKAVPAVFLAQLLTTQFIYGKNLSFDAIPQLLVSAFAAYVAFAILAMCGRGAFFAPQRRDGKLYRDLLTAGFLASLVNAAGLILLPGETLYSDQLLPTIVTQVIGDSIGLLTLLLMLMAFFRLQRLLP